MPYFLLCVPDCSVHVAFAVAVCAALSLLSVLSLDRRKTAERTDVDLEPVC